MKSNVQMVIQMAAQMAAQMIAKLFQFTLAETTRSNQKGKMNHRTDRRDRTSGFSFGRLTLQAGAAISIAFSALQTQAQIWQDTRVWDDAAEEAYSRWVETEFHEKFFTQGKYAGIATDCADAAYYARLIFAYENKLPFRIHSGLSNRSTKFNGRPEFERVKRFINLVGDTTSTRTLALDTYPVAITRENVRPGGVWSRPSLTSQGLIGFFLRALSLFNVHTETSSGHATIIKRVEATGAIWMIESTLPRALRDLVETASLHFMPELVDVPDDLQDPEAREQLRYGMGLRRWRQPQHYGIPLRNLPGFSTEQFEIGVDPRTTRNDGEGSAPTPVRNLSSWTAEVYEKLAAGSQETPALAAERILRTLCNAAHARTKIVQKALEALARQATCFDEKSQAYDDFSTPSRDSRALNGVNELRALVRPHIFGENKEVKAAVNRVASECAPLEIGGGQTLSIQQYMKNLRDGRVSSNPNHSLEDRWGIAAEKTLACKPKDI